METKETTTYSRLSDEEKKILMLVDRGYRVTDIARELRVSKSKVSKKLRKMLDEGYVVKRDKYYYLTDKGRFYLSVSSFSMGTMGFLRFEGLRVVFDRVVRLRNVQQYILDGPDGSKVYVIFGRRVSVMVLFPRVRLSRFRFFSEFLAWFNNLLWRIVKWLSDNGVVVDLSSMRIASQETALNLDEYSEAVDESRHIVELGRNALTALGEADFKAKAWIDRSIGPLEVESNDFRYVEKLIMMPELVYELYSRILPSFQESIKLFDKKIEDHLGYIKIATETNMEIRDSIKTLTEYLKELKDQMKQPNLLSKLKSLFRRLV